MAKRRSWRGWPMLLACLASAGAGHCGGETSRSTDTPDATGSHDAVAKEGSSDLEGADDGATMDSPDPPTDSRTIVDSEPESADGATDNAAPSVDSGRTDAGVQEMDAAGDSGIPGPPIEGDCRTGTCSAGQFCALANWDGMTLVQRCLPLPVGCSAYGCALDELETFFKANYPPGETLPPGCGCSDGGPSILDGGASSTLIVGCFGA